MFTRRGGAASAETALQQLVLSRVGRTTHLAELDSMADAAAVAEAASADSVLPPEDEGALVLRQSEAEDAMRDILPSRNRSRSGSSDAASRAAALAVPSLAVLQRIAVLTHHAATVLAAPAAGMADSLRSIELCMALPTDPLDPAAKAKGSSVRLWVFRVHELLLCFPTASLSASAAGSGGCTLQTLESALRPLLLCLSAHFRCVAQINARAERALKKAIDKQQKQAVAAGKAR